MHGNASGIGSDPAGEYLDLSLEARERHLLTTADQTILDQDYPRGKIDKKIAIRFANQQRGSMRYALGLFRTEDEQDEFIQKGLRVELP